MRDIEFRGKDVCYGEWLYGFYLMSLSQDNNKRHHVIQIDGLAFDVDPETVGQYTGLKAKNSVHVFDGDIVKDGAGSRYLIYWHDEALSWFVKNGDLDVPLADLDGCVSVLKVIGNIHDDPKLLEEIK